MIYVVLKISNDEAESHYPSLTLKDMITGKEFIMGFNRVMLNRLLIEQGLEHDNMKSFKGRYLHVVLSESNSPLIHKADADFLAGLAWGADDMKKGDNV